MHSNLYKSKDFPTFLFWWKQFPFKVLIERIGQGWGGCIFSHPFVLQQMNAWMEARLNYIHTFCNFHYLHWYCLHATNNISNCLFLPMPVTIFTGEGMYTSEIFGYTKFSFKQNDNNHSESRLSFQTPETFNIWE